MLHAKLPLAHPTSCSAAMHIQAVACIDKPLTTQRDNFAALRSSHTPHASTGVVSDAAGRALHCIPIHRHVHRPCPRTRRRLAQQDAAGTRAHQTALRRHKWAAHQHAPPGQRHCMAPPAAALTSFQDSIAGTVLRWPIAPSHLHDSLQPPWSPTARRWAQDGGGGWGPGGGRLQGRDPAETCTTAVWLLPSLPQVSPATRTGSKTCPLPSFPRPI